MKQPSFQCSHLKDQIGVCFLIQPQEFGIMQEGFHSTYGHSL